MSTRTGIAWTDHTWNPWHGCTKVSPGCAHCYMFRDKLRWGQPADVVLRSRTKFKEPLGWSAPAKVFTCSWSDFFHEAADTWRAEAWEIIRRTPHLTYQILTKRPERITAHLPADWGGLGYDNVWLGVSVENQRHASRIDHLCSIPTRLRFVSAEPLLGPLDLAGALQDRRDVDLIRWVIVGGESGPEARPMNEEWARDLRDQCAATGVAFYLKQLGGHPDARAHEKAILDGVTHTAFPAAP